MIAVTSPAMPTTVARTRALVVGAVGVAVVLGGLAVWHPAAPLAVVALVGVGALVWSRPAVAAYLVIGLTPLTAGVDRGTLLPVLRPNEALDVLVAAMLGVRWLLTLRTGQVPRPRLAGIEWTLLLLAVTSSLWPLAVMFLRQQQPNGEDISYALVLWKYLGVYVIVRAAVHTTAEVRRCLWVSMASAAVVATIAVLQSLDLLGVSGLLTSYTTNGNTDALSIGRGSATLGLPAAVADLMIYNLAIALALVRRQPGTRVVLGCLCAVFTLGALAAGEFSSASGVVIGVVAAAAVTGTGALLLRWSPLLACAGVVALWPVIQTRLSGFDSVSGLPVSWTGRLYNLENYFWPQVFSGWNWLLGIRPAARIPAPHRANGYVWIESGYTWLLWGGGVALLASFVLFVWVALAWSRRIALGEPGPAGAAAAAVFAGVIVIAVLMLFDPHLTYRGAADSMFGLLALTRLGDRESGRQHQEAS